MGLPLSAANRGEVSESRKTTAESTPHPQPMLARLHTSVCIRSRHAALVCVFVLRFALAMPGNTSRPLLPTEPGEALGSGTACGGQTRVVPMAGYFTVTWSLPRGGSSSMPSCQTPGRISSHLPILYFPTPTPADISIKG